MLTLYPTIDLRDGAVARPRRNDMCEAALCSADPAAHARAWQTDRCAWRHVVDLSGAFAARPVNAHAVTAIHAPRHYPRPALRRGFPSHPPCDKLRVISIPTG